MQPINYLAQVADPFAQSLQGYKLGAGMAEAQQKQAAAEQQRLATQQYNQALSRLQSPTATAADFENMIMISGKDQAANLKTVMESRDARQNQAALKQVSPIAFALKTGNVEQGIALLTQQAEAARNSGDTQEATYLTQMAEQAKANPVNVGNLFASKMTLIPGGKDALDNLLKMTQERRVEAEAPSKLKEQVAKADKAQIEADFATRLQEAGLNKSNWDVKNLQSQINVRAAQLKLDQQTTAATVAEKLSSIQKNLNDIPTDTRKLINEAAVAGAVAKQSADQFNDLAKRIEGLGGYGKLATLGEFAKSTIGAEGYETSLRQEYTRLRNQAAIKSLPPGPATDKDIEMALRGFPKDTSDSKSIAQFLKGMAKLQEIESAVSNSKTDWLAQNRGTLTRAGSTFTAGDYAVKPGETFNDFSQRVAVDVNKKYASGGTSALVEQIPTDRNPTPGAAQANVRSQADAILRGGK